MKKVTHFRGKILGITSEIWQYKKAVAQIIEYPDMALLFSCKSLNENKGEMQHLLANAQRYYVTHGLKFMGTVPLTEPMVHIYAKMGIEEIPDDQVFYRDGLGNWTFELKKKGEPRQYVKRKATHEFLR